VARLIDHVAEHVRSHVAVQLMCVHILLCAQHTCTQGCNHAAVRSHMLLFVAVCYFGHCCAAVCALTRCCAVGCFGRCCAFTHVAVHSHDAVRLVALVVAVHSHMLLSVAACSLLCVYTHVAVLSHVYTHVAVLSHVAVRLFALGVAVCLHTLLCTHTLL